MKTATEIAEQALEEIGLASLEHDGLSGWATDSTPQEALGIIERAIEADRAQRDFSNPLPLSETPGGVFVNESGEKLIEPIGDEGGEIILVRTDGTTATLRGEWETGFAA